MDWLADRFFNLNGRWIDSASGADVRLHITDGSSARALEWDEQCARLARARHPVLNPLLDYGPLHGGRRFEAFSRLPPLPDAVPLAIRAHATRFLVASGVVLDREREAAALREVVRTSGRPFDPSRTSGSSRAGSRDDGLRAGPIRALGITLQPRRALEAIHEALESPAAATTVVTVVGSQSSGLRTLKLLVARDARMSGFIPIAPAVLGRHIADPAIEGRHFCVLDDGAGEDGGVGGLLMRLAATSARQHVVVRFRRIRSGRHAIPLDPLSVRALVGMVFVERGAGPTEAELFDAARLADGRPGAFLVQLTASSARQVSMVHETPEPYIAAIAAPVVEEPPPPASRLLRRALGATARAKALAARGRFAAAERLLLRAARVLSGRGRPVDASACLVAAGSLALDRGRTGTAVRVLSEARSMAADDRIAVRAAIALAGAWIADARLIEAEALLRATCVAAQAAGDRANLSAAAAGLVTSLNLQDRHGDAVAAASCVDFGEEDPASLELLAALSRSHAALGRTALALRLSRQAESLATGGGAGRQAVAALAVAAALGHAGDSTGALAALRRARALARAGRLPLVAVAARVAQCELVTAAASGDTEQNLRTLRALKKLRLPRRYTEHIARVARLLETGAVAFSPSARVCDAPPSLLETLLAITHRAPDDAGAVAGVCGEVIARLRAASVSVITANDRRVLATAGRSFQCSPSILGQALASGSWCGTDAGVEPIEIVEPVRHGVDVIAAFAVRWTAGAGADLTAAAPVLRAAALASAAAVRALIDAALPAAPAGAWGDLLGGSAPAVTLREAVTRAARAPFPVLIEGESGSGKELVARAIHRLSARRDRRVCAVNCAALSDELVETELFGHARGAFTGAASERAGLFEEADGGTLFLDEVAELSPRAQAKLLRVLQEGEVRRVGENFARRVDVRVVAATNRELAAEAAAGRFRPDLRFRLDVVRIVVPPLRERPGDVPVLAAHFWNDASQRVGSRATLTADALSALARYDWPGNVRELQNVIAWMAVHSPRRGRVGPSALPAHVAQSAAPGARTLATARDEFERRFVRAALAGADGQLSRAARAMGVSRQGLAKLMRRLDIRAT